MEYNTPVVGDARGVLKEINRKITHRFDLESSVLALLGESVFDHDHRTDIVRALDMAHVVTLDAQRRIGQLEVFLQLVQRLAEILIVFGDRGRARITGCCRLLCGRSSGAFARSRRSRRS